MYTAIIQHMGNTCQVEAAPGTTLMEALRLAGVSLDLPCSGNHTCGKCGVWAEGGLSPVGEQEARLLGGATGRRLACFAKMDGDCRIRTGASRREDLIATEGAADSLPPDPIYSGTYGAAFDIGTTTVVGYLFTRASNEPLAVLGETNRQRAYGADVLTRIVYCNEHTVSGLRDLIREQLAQMLSVLCVQAGIPHWAVSGLCVTGNTTMLHILAGLEPRSLALAPFTPLSLFDGAYDLELAGFPGLRAWLPRCISAYVGADITCSILTSGIARRPDTVLLVDIGTNGEMALKTAGGLTCCSTAAGPAFEGAGISAGMNAQSGAISRVWAEEGQIQYSVIGGAAPIGLCGSGLLDAAAAMVSLGWIRPSGRMDPKWEGRAPVGDSGVFLTQGDVRQLQLAKGAIRGGMDTLMETCGVSYETLDQIVLCGGFGSFLNVHTAEAIGLIPPGTACKTIAIGNAAGAGAGRILQNSARRTEATAIAQAAEAVDLSTSPYFKKRYVEVMGF